MRHGRACGVRTAFEGRPCLAPALSQRARSNRRGAERRALPTCACGPLKPSAACKRYEPLDIMHGLQQMMTACPRERWHTSLTSAYGGVRRNIRWHTVRSRYVPRNRVCSVHNHPLKLNDVRALWCASKVVVCDARKLRREFACNALRANSFVQSYGTQLGAQKVTQQE